VPLYQLFYDGDKPPKTANLSKLKSSDDIAFGVRGKEAKELARFQRLLSRIKPTDRKMLMFMASKMARA
jgi:hypothetical protein